VPYAHSLRDRPTSEWQPLEEHLAFTADLAEQYASSYAPGWGRLAGLWHDLGKYQPAFQRYIGADPEEHCESAGRTAHSGAGALLARVNQCYPLAFVIAGHHAGLCNKEALKARLEREGTALDESRRGGIPPGVEAHQRPSGPAGIKTKQQLALWTRMIFSALVDADYIDTERFYQPDLVRGAFPALPALEASLSLFLDTLQTQVDASPVNEMRRRILNSCLLAASEPPGLFSLTVPTGGGKTYASLAFALRHAVQWSKRRIIVVIPYTSILEQTAAAFRRALAGNEDTVVEHHSNLDPDRESARHKLACENWDAPIVVTTSVQFFESLYANRTSRCRKLHNVADSVVVFDEVQTFPANLLDPVRHVLRELAANYNSTLVFCTATQPALGLPAREIVPDVQGEFGVVRHRCSVRFPSTPEPVTWESLAAEIRAEPRVLAIVHRRADAEALASLVGEDCLHLSARMCALHRTQVLARVKAQPGACRLIATQLVEAGVDLDFPVVYRAMAGADSLAQAAGRCNREGRGRGELRIFQAPTQPPPGILRKALATAQSLQRENLLDLSNPQTFPEYFRRLYAYSELDPGVLAAEDALNFEDSARLFRLIDDSGAPVLAPFADWQQRLNSAQYSPSRTAYRRLQPVTVSLYPNEISTLRGVGALYEALPGLYAVTQPYVHVYDLRFGFRWQGTPNAEPESLIA
jgi:CRISPR-associated endonuclease/helicase Cas3